MKRIAFISDVHSNLEALDAVLVQTAGTELYCLGDIVGYGADPNSVIQKLRGVRAAALMGNHDSAVITGDTSWFNPKAAAAAEWTSKHLSQENRDYLKSLPLEIRTEFDGLGTFLTHGSPDDNLREYVELETHSSFFDTYLNRLGVKVVGLGHTHRPFASREKSGLVFNPGSVGQPRDGDPRASFAFATFAEGEAHIELRRVEYDVDAAAAKILKAGLPRTLAARLFEGM